MERSVRRRFLSVSVSLLLTLFAVGPSVHGDAEKKQSILHKAHLPQGWYPHDKQVLLEYLKKCFSLSQTHFSVPGDHARVKALVAPHAGYYYSGLCAASAYQTIAKRINQDGTIVKNDAIKRVIIMAPTHAHLFQGIALPDYTDYKTPLGEISVDSGAIEKLQKHTLFKVVPQAHDPEHSIEVQLPFLQACLKKFSIIPLVVGSVNESDYEAIAKTLAEIVDDKTLIVVSSDMVHYGANYRYAPFTQDVFYSVRRVDSQAIFALSECSFAEFDAMLARTKATICGRSPIKILLKLIEQRALGDISCRLASYYSSAQLQDPREANRAKIDDLFKSLPDSQVQNSVSYAGLVFTQEKLASLVPKDRLTGYEKRALLTLARDAISNEFAAAKARDFLLYPVLSKGIKTVAGAFVTLNKDSKLRGCIGRIVTGDPLFQTVSDMAKSAAFHDGRFTPLTKTELSDIDVDITVLTRPRSVESYKEIKLGTHGIILKKRLADGTLKTAVFLPQVPGSFGWDLASTLSALSSKAGLDKDAWKKGCTFEVFEGFEVKEQ